MKQYKKKMLMLLLGTIIMLIPACSKSNRTVSSEVEKKFLEMYPFQDMNRSLRISARDGDSINHFDENIPLAVDNFSDYQIYLPADASLIRLFVIHDGNWIQISDKTKYYGEPGILDPRGQLASEWLTGIWPILNSELQGEENVWSVRILVTGELIKGGEGSGITVGAYTDITVSQ